MTTEIDRVAQIQQEWGRELPDLDVSPMGVIGRLHRLGMHLTDELVAVYRAHGLTEGEFDILATLLRRGTPHTISAGALSEQTMVTTGGLSKRLDRLAERGLITRRVADDDARGRIVTLTDHGKATIEAAFSDHMRNEARLVAQFGTANAAALEPLLREWLAHYEPDN